MVRYIRYCENCVMPETKPDLHIDEQGICSACRNFEKRVDVDWSARRANSAGVTGTVFKSDRSRPPPITFGIRRVG